MKTDIEDMIKQGQEYQHQNDNKTREEQGDGWWNGKGGGWTGRDLARKEGDWGGDDWRGDNGDGKRAADLRTQDERYERRFDATR